MNYDPKEHTLTAEIARGPVTITFESDAPETTIWHYVLAALPQRETDALPRGMPRLK